MNKIMGWARDAAVSRLIAGALFAGSVVACGGGSAAVGIPAPAPVPMPPVADVKPGVWVVMGSSTAAGAGATTSKGWVDLLQAALSTDGVEVVNIAKGGTVTYHGLSLASEQVSGRPAPDPAANIDAALVRNPVVLLIAYPSNDTANGYSADETINNILTIRATALARNIAVIVLSTQPRNLNGEQLATLMIIDERLSAAVGACFVDVRTALAGSDGRLASFVDAGDGVHPNDAGHKLIAARVTDVLDGGKCVRLAAN